MPMTAIAMVRLCECCAIFVANGDESSCRDYFHHTHRTPEVPANTVVGDDWGYADDWWHCDGCDTEQMPYSTRWHCDVLGKVAA